MSSKPERNGNTTSTQGRTGEVSAQDLFDKQKAYFATDVTKTYQWRIHQLDRLSRMLKENDKRFSEASRRDFKTALQENIFEVVASLATIEFTKSQLKEWISSSMTWSDHVAHSTTRSTDAAIRNWRVVMARRCLAGRDWISARTVIDEIVYNSNHQGVE